MWIHDNILIHNADIRASGSRMLNQLLSQAWLSQPPSPKIWSILLLAATQLLISLLISHKNFVLDHDKIYLISLSILNTKVLGDAWMWQREATS